MSSKRLLAALLFYLLWGAVPPSAWAASGYKLVDLGSVATGSASVGISLSESGLVSGQYVDTSSGVPRNKGFLYDGTGFVTLDPMLGGFGVNDDGLVVGPALVSGKSRATTFLGGVVVDIGAGDGSSASAVNMFGQIAGHYSPPWIHAYESHAFVYTPGEGIADLGTLGGGSSLARGMNNKGQVVGESQTNLPDGITHAFLATATGGMRDLGSLGTDSYAMAINDSGRVTGYSDTDPDPGVTAVRAFVWDEVNGMVSLGALGAHSVGMSLNKHGVVVGSNRDALGKDSAFIYSQEMGMRDLHRFLDLDTGAGWMLNTALDINDSGLIVGVGTFDGRSRGYLLVPSDDIRSPIPEPQTYVLLAIGLMLLGIKSVRLTSSPATHP